MPMKNPPHLGGIIKDCLEELGLFVTHAAQVLDVTRPTLSRVINGKSAISPEMAIRLSKAFGSSAEMWLRMQTAYDLAQAHHLTDRINVQRYEPLQAVGEHLQSPNGL
jgi:antitoxin HigA-1